MERFHGSPDDVHEWLSFEDPGEHRTWMADATFLRSAWTCIYGAGCQGVLDRDASDLQQGCCSYGAHFVDDDDVATVTGALTRLSSDQWQYFDEGTTDGVLATDDEGTTTTRLVDGACIFLNRPGFSRGAGCALHVAAVDAGERPLDWKPDVCWQLPLRLEHHTDESGHVTSTLREWKRRDWGPAGEDFHWWCTDAPDAFVGRGSVYTEMGDEIIELVGESAYARIGELLTHAVPLPHPAVRR